MKTRIILFSLLFLFVGTISVSCRKKKETVAKIIVKYTNNDPVGGATVILYGESTTGQGNVTLYDTARTNSSGEAIFNFDDVYQLGQAGVAVLNIDVEYSSNVGYGIIKVEEETTTTETIYIQ